VPVAAPAQWGRRLSDAIREALDAGDFASARRLALDGDGQARSLEKEYALMYRGLGITLRVLLNILGQMPVGDECGALLRRFREDMTACMGRVYTSPGARRALEGVPALLAQPSGSDVGAELARTARFLDAAEDLFVAEQGRLAREAVGALEAGDAARARALVDDKERGQYVPLHDRTVRFMAEVFGHVLERFGPAELLRFHRAAAEGQRQGFEKWERMSPAEFAQATAFLLKQHMGQVHVREDAEKFTIEQTPCGSGGRLRLAGAYSGPGALPLVGANGPLTLGQEGFPVYCSHCPVWNSVAPVEWFGRPHWVFDNPSRQDGSCTLHIYKRRDGAPRDYVRRLAVPGPPR
jgi:hypothetical protein